MASGLGKARQLEENEIYALLNRCYDDTSSWNEDEDSKESAEIYEPNVDTSENQESSEEEENTSTRADREEMANEVTELQESNLHIHQRTGKPITKKRKCQPETWKCNIRKKARQSGKEYVNSKGKKTVARSVKTIKDCSKCKFHCSANIAAEEREAIFNEFWGSTDNEKLNFYARTTMQTDAKRPGNKAESRRLKSITYSLPLNNELVRVCKVFYLTTLDINHKRVQLFHKNKQKVCGTPAALKRGDAVNRRIPEQIKDDIRAHIESLPRVESHYNRANTKKEYLASGLNLTILHEKYVEQCERSGRVQGKLHLYRQIFNTEFNIGFHVPKKDRCDVCEAIKQNPNPTEEEIKENEKHLHGKQETKRERDNDRKNQNAFTICFDLQNVFALPKADVSNFFYKRKLNVYHMTAHCSTNKKGYGTLWHEGQSGRTGNDIASSVVKILDAIVEENTNDPRMKNLVLWSDSCVPQNRNSHFATAIKNFLKRHPEIVSIEHKYCEPGHSCIQEVDNLHSQIEAVCCHCEIYSPIGLLRMLKKVNRSNPMKIIQMKADDFRDYANVANKGMFFRVPFTQVKALLYKQKEPRTLSYKTSFSDEWASKSVWEEKNTRGRSKADNFEVPDAKIAAQRNALSQAKKNDLKSMLRFMPYPDREFMENLSK